MNLKEQYWEAAERLLQEFFYPDPELEAKFKKEKEKLMDQYIDIPYYAYVCEPYYVVSDLMQWDWWELWGWVEINIDKINEICRDVYDVWYDLKRSKDHDVER